MARLLTVTEAGERLRLKPESVRNMARDGVLPHVRYSQRGASRVLIPEDAVDAFIAEHTYPAR